MASYDQLFVFKACYKLLLALYNDLNKLPRDVKYTVLQDIKRETLDVLRYIYRANSTTDKVPLLDMARDKMFNVTINIRILWDLKVISEKKYGRFAEMVEGVSKQLTAWQKSVEKKQNDNNLQQQ